MANLALSLGFVKDLFSSQALNGSGSSAYSEPFVIEKAENFGLTLKASGSSPHIKIIKCYNFDASIDANGDPDSTTWAEQDETGAEDVFVSDFTQTEWSHGTPDFKYNIWAKLRAIGIQNNSQNTTISVKLIKQAKERL